VTLTTVSPLAVYFDKTLAGGTLALRPTSLDGKVVGLLPNWRPAAVPLLNVIRGLLEERFHLRTVIVEQAVNQPSNRSGTPIDAIRERLDDIAQRVDVLIAASGD
jgi:hypothetical protein